MFLQALDAHEEKEERDRLAHKAAANVGKAKRGRAKAKGNNNNRAKANDNVSNGPAGKKNAAPKINAGAKQKGPATVSMKRV